MSNKLDNNLTHHNGCSYLKHIWLIFSFTKGKGLIDKNLTIWSI